MVFCCSLLLWVIVSQLHPSLIRRKIIHVDMDCFFAAVEISLQPELKGKPVIVGGDPRKRGVVSTCSYEARKFGVKSAMPCKLAARLCPEGIFLKPNIDRYREYAVEVRRVFYSYTDLVEPMSLDEAYLDVTGHELRATKIAQEIRKNIYDQLGLTASAGVAPNKLVAKIASDFYKPNGLTVVTPENVAKFMQDLPLRKINGIGPATEKSLLQYKLRKCSDVWAYSLEQLVSILGERMGSWLYHRSRGIDDSPVESQRGLRKSLSNEVTFDVDLIDFNELLMRLKELLVSLVVQLKDLDLAARTITLKLRYGDFKSLSRSHSFTYYTQDLEDFESILIPLLQKTESGVRPVRLIGLCFSKLMCTRENHRQSSSKQPLLFS